MRGEGKTLKEKFRTPNLPAKLSFLDEYLQSLSGGFE
jgi:hypothetical protein